MVAPGVLFVAEKTMERYSVIREKRPREIVLLRGSGCIYKRCTFCDYHLDSCPDQEANDLLNREVLSRVTGEYGDLEVINSGSVFELSEQTRREIRRVCGDKRIGTIHFESHYLYRERIPALRQEFEGFTLKMKLGLETFDSDYRERVLHKGIKESDPAVLSSEFQEANLLFGLTGQTEESMTRDIELGLQYFERICVNLMCENTTPVKPDPEVIRIFTERIEPLWRENDRVDILLNNTDFGVGD